MNQSTRPETDSIGQIMVPSNMLWGAQTQRSLQNFAIGKNKIPEGRPNQISSIPWSSLNELWPKSTYHLASNPKYPTP